MTLAIAATLVGLVILAWSADKFVAGAAVVARALGMAPLLVGMFIIGFGTSAPEVAVSALSAAQGAPEMALGNVFGSSVANIGLVLGLSAVLVPIAVKRGILRKELPLLIVVTALAWVLLLDGELSRLDAGILFTALIANVVWLVRQARRNPGDQLGKDTSQAADARAMSPRAAWVWLVAGLALLVLASWALVWGATHIARELGWSDLVIGLTVVAVGTSAPEIATSITAVRRGETELALGNIIGSNLFNTLAVTGVAGLIAPAVVSSELLSRDLPVVMGMTLLLVAFGFRWRSHGRINRVEGAVLVTLWLAYTGYLLASAS